MLGDGQRSTGREVVALVTAAAAHDTRSLEELARSCSHLPSAALTTARLLGAVLQRIELRSGTPVEVLLTGVEDDLTGGTATQAEQEALRLVRRVLAYEEVAPAELGATDVAVLVALAELAAGGLEAYHQLGGVPSEWMLQSLGLSFA